VAWLYQGMAIPNIVSLPGLMPLSEALAENAPGNLIDDDVMRWIWKDGEQHLHLGLHVKARLAFWRMGSKWDLRHNTDITSEGCFGCSCTKGIYLGSHRVTARGGTYCMQWM
jgi:hypothetical protein